MEADALALQYFEIDPTNGQITVRSNLEFGAGGSTLTFRVNRYSCCISVHIKVKLNNLLTNCGCIPTLEAFSFLRQKLIL